MRSYPIDCLFSICSSGFLVQMVGKEFPQRNHVRALRHSVAMGLGAPARRDLADACKAVKGGSVGDRLLEARMVKADKVGGKQACAT